MNPVRINATPEVHPGSGPKGMFLLGDCVERLESLLPEWEGRVKLVYMDPLYLTGEKFYMRLRVGEAELVLVVRHEACSSDLPELYRTYFHNVAHRTE